MSAAALKRPIANEESKMNPARCVEDLFLLATNRFADCDTHDRLSLRYYQEAFDLLYSKVSRNARQLVGRILAFCPQTPRAIAMQLALEDLAIAKPVVLHSSVLGQLDLLQILEAKGVGHAELIARRPDIGPSLLGRLRGLGEPGISKALDGNEALVDGRTIKDPQSLFQTIGLKEENETSAVSNSKSRFNEAETRLLQAASRRGLDIGAETLASDQTPQETFEGPLGDTLETLAAEKDRQGTALAMRQYGGIALGAAFQVLEQQSGESMAVFLKAHEVDEAQTNRILMLTFPAIGLSVHNAMGMVTFYRDLKTESCQEAVARWPQDSSLKPHQPVFEETGSRRRANLDRTDRTGGSAGEQLQEAV